MDYVARALAVSDMTKDLYRTLHRMPEPSRFEFETHAFLRARLAQWGIPFLAPEKNITVAVVRGDRPGGTVGIRCETDALQMTEETHLPYASERPGLMHGCGHDAHMASGLTAAMLLSENRAELCGTVKIIFQPAEEGELGARAVLASGTVNDVDAFFAIHVWSGYESGELRVCDGAICASTDMFKLTVKGRSGHGAYPELCRDAIACAAQIVTALQHIASRFTAALDPVVVTVGSFNAGTRCNIIAGEAVLEGTVRAFSPETRARVLDHIRAVARDVCDMHGCSADFQNVDACDVTINDPVLADVAREAALLIDPAGAKPAGRLMIGDDFAEYRRVAPGCYAQVGIRNEKIGACHAHHNGLFRVDEEALYRCVAWECLFAQRAAAR